jgi:nitronate monooxygenase
LQLLEQVRAALPPEHPVFLAGGIAERGDVRTAMEAGATAAVAGTRFLLAKESRAHPAYRQRLVEASKTILTDLFGAAWPAPHRPTTGRRRWSMPARSTRGRPSPGSATSGRRRRSFGI